MDVAEDNEHLMLWDDEVEQWREDQPSLWWRVFQYLLMCLIGGIGVGVVVTMVAVVVFVVFGFGALLGGLSAL